MSNNFDAKGNGEQAIAQLATKILGAGDGLRPSRIRPGNPRHPGGKPTMSANLMASAVKNSAML